MFGLDILPRFFIFAPSNHDDGRRGGRARTKRAVHLDREDVRGDQAENTKDQTSDHALLARVRAGDVAAFETIFRTHYPALLRFALTLIADRDTAQDVVQDVFGWVWTHRAEWQPSHIESYLIGAVRHRTLHVARGVRLHGAAEQRYVAPGESPAMGSSAATDSMVETNDLTAHIWAAIAALPEPRRTVLLLRWRHGYDWEETAAILGTSVAATRMQHTRALQALRAQLTDDLI